MTDSLNLNSPFARRAFMAGMAGAVAVPAIASSASGSSTLTVTSQGRRSQYLAQMMGVVTVTSTRDGIYGNRELVKSRLQELGAANIRTRLFDGNKGQVEFLRQLAGSGFRVNALMGDPDGTAGTPEQLVKLVADQLTGVVRTMEGANEWNLNGGLNWVSELRNHQVRLYRAAKANPRTRHLPVLSPALGMRTGFTSLGSLERYCDYGNIHLYTGGFIPGYRSDDMLAAQRVVSGAKPIIVTETGWHNAMRSGVTHHPTPEQTAAVYGPRLYLEYFTRGVPRVFMFQLLDDAVDPSMTDHEAHFGLLRTDYSRKPVFKALTNFMSMLDAPNTAAAPAGAPLTYSIRNAPSDLMRVLVRRNDGAYILFLWRRVSAYDNIARKLLRVPMAPVTVTFPRRASVQQFRPTDQREALSAARQTSGVEVDLDAEVVGLLIRP